MTNERFASVWDAIEDTRAQAENMKLRSALMTALKDNIARKGLSPSQAAKVFGVTQPRVSDLMRGKIDLFGLDTVFQHVGRRRSTHRNAGAIETHRAIASSNA